MKGNSTKGSNPNNREGKRIKTKNGGSSVLNGGMAKIKGSWRRPSKSGSK